MVFFNKQVFVYYSLKCVLNDLFFFSLATLSFDLALFMWEKNTNGKRNLSDENNVSYRNGDYRINKGSFLKFLLKVQNYNGAHY